MEALENRLKPPRPKGPRVRLEVTVRSSPRFRAGASEVCPPAGRNLSEIRRRLDSYAGSTRRPGSAIVWVFISGQGDVHDAKIHRSSGVKVVDDIALAVTRYMRFYSALNDRAPVPVWLSVPINIEVR
jgi:TonB family protein